MAELIKTYLREILTVIIPLCVFLANKFFSDRAKLVQSIRHSFTFLIDEPMRGKDGEFTKTTQTVQTASVSIYNAGREAANKLEVVFNWRPQYINIWPNRAYTEKLLPDGKRYALLFDYLSSKDIVGFELLSINMPLPEITSVRSEQSVARIVNLLPQPIPKTWQKLLFVTMFTIGVGATVYVASTAIKWLAISSTY